MTQDEIIRRENKKGRFLDPRFIGHSDSCQCHNCFEWHCCDAAHKALAELYQADDDKLKAELEQATKGSRDANL